MGNKTTKCPDKSSDSVKATTAKKGETRLMGNGLSLINRVPARWKNLQLYRARNLLFACEIFLAHKFWSINPRVVIPVNLISVDRESEKVAPPCRFLDRFLFSFFLVFFPSFGTRAYPNAHAFRASIIRFEVERKGGRKETARDEASGKRVSQPVVNCFCFIASFSLCSPLLQSGKNPGTSHRDTLNYFWNGGWN